MNVRKMMTAISLPMIVCINSQANASLFSDTYVSGQLGLTHHRIELSGRDNKYKTAWGVAAGKYVTKNLALSLGFLDTARYMGRNSLNSNFSAKSNIIDLTANLYFPLSDKLNLNFGVGGAFVLTNIKDINNMPLKHNTLLHVRPEIGIGVSYDINTKLAAELSFKSIMGEKTRTYVPQLNIASIGFRYKLAD